MGGKGPRYHPVVGKLLSPLSMFQSQSPEPVDMLGPTAGVGIKVADELTLRWGDCSEFSWWKGEAARSKPGRDLKVLWRKTEDGPKIKDSWAPPEAGKIRVFAGASGGEGGSPAWQHRDCSPGRTGLDFRPPELGGGLLQQPQETHIPPEVGFVCFQRTCNGKNTFCIKRWPLLIVRIPNAWYGTYWVPDAVLHASRKLVHLALTKL